MKLIGDNTRDYVLLPKNKSAIIRPTFDAWGWLPALSLTSASGVMLVALAAEAGRLASQWAEPLFWLGLSVLFVPAAVRMISSQPTRRERIALLVMLGCALYLLRDLEQPLSFAYNDEFLMWPAAQNIATSGHLFHPNSISPISPFYPGLQIATTALSSLTGLSIFVSGMIVLGVAGLVLVLGFYLFFEYLSGSVQVAGIATLLYMAKPTFFDDTLFHYEDLAMPIMAFVLFAIVRRSYAPKGSRISFTLAIWPALAAVVITHHVASYMLDLILLLWTVTFLLLKAKASFHQSRDEEAHAGPRGAALLAIVLSLAWLAYTGARAVDHIYPALETTVNQFVRILTGGTAPRQLFHDSVGFVDPLWERVMEEAAVALISLGLPFGLFQIWRHYRTNAAALALAVGVLAYPVSLVIRLTRAGVNIGGRAQPYLFIMVAFVLALGITHFWLPRFSNWRYKVLLVGAIAIIFIGGWVSGTSPLWDRLPGPYLPSADQRSITPEGVAAAEWAGSYLGSGQRVIGDQYTRLLMATYGNERIVTTSQDQVIVSPVFTSPQFDSDVVAILRHGRIQYIVVDRRLSTGLPRIGWYFDGNEPGYTRPVDPAWLAKFDGVQNLSRIFDSGDIIVYDVEAFTSKASITPPPKSLCAQTAVPGSYPQIARAYTGTILDIPAGITILISITGVQQQHETICGYFSVKFENALPNGTPANGTIKGTVAADKHIWFTLTNDRGKATFSFDGLIQPDGTIGGTYCNVGVVTGQCSDYGLWSTSPTQPG